MKKNKGLIPLVLMILSAAVPCAAQDFPYSAVTDHFALYSTGSDELPGWITRLEAMHADFSTFWGPVVSGSQERITVYLVRDAEEGKNLLTGLGLSGGERYPLLLEGHFPADDKLVILLAEKGESSLLSLFSRVFLRRRFGPLPEGLSRGFALYSGSGEIHNRLADQFRNSLPAEPPYEQFLGAKTDGSQDLLLWAMAVYYAESPDSPQVRAFREYLVLRGGNPRYDEENPGTASRLFDAAFQKDFTAFWKAYPTPSSRTDEAIALYKKKEYDKSATLLGELLPLTDDYRVPYYLGLISVERKKYTEALILFERSKSLGAPGELILYATGICWWYLNDREKGLAALTGAATINPALYGERVYRLTGKKIP